MRSLRHWPSRRAPAGTSHSSHRILRKQSPVAVESRGPVLPRISRASRRLSGPFSWVSAHASGNFGEFCYTSPVAASACRQDQEDQQGESDTTLLPETTFSAWGY